MDVIQYLPNCFTPAKLKAEESSAASDGGFASKKRKADEALAAMEAYLTSDLKDLKAVETAEEIPAAGEDELEEDNFIRIFRSKYGEPEPLDEEERVVEYEGPVYGTYEYDPEDADRPQYRRYIEDYNRSQGFDIDHYFPGELIPLYLEGEDGDFIAVSECKKMVQDVIQYQNAKNGWNLKLEKVTKCNYIPGHRFYATFDATNEATGDTITFQAAVGRNYSSGKTIIFMFRVKPDSSLEPKQ